MKKEGEMISYLALALEKLARCNLLAFFLLAVVIGVELLLGLSPHGGGMRKSPDSGA